MNSRNEFGYGVVLDRMSTEWTWSVPGTRYQEATQEINDLALENQELKKENRLLKRALDRAESELWKNRNVKGYSK